MNKTKIADEDKLIIAQTEIVFQKSEYEKLAVMLGIANKELAFQKDEREKRAAELGIANVELAFQNEEKEKRAAELIVANYARSLIEASLDPLVTISADGKITDVNAASIKVTGIAREKLIGTDFSNYFTEPKKAQEGYLQVFEKGFVSDYPLTIKHKDGNLTDVLYNASVYKDSKGKILGVFAAARDVTEQKWAKDLRVANAELAYQNDEKEKRAAELVIANKELAFQNDEKEKRASELNIANKELAFQNNEKEKRAAELSIANIELAFQNDEKEKRADELTIANKELAFQNDEKEKRAAEKEKRAIELGIANKELAFQNKEKEKRAAELAIANKELAFQNKEKEKRADELIIANEELAFQSDEKEKRAAELIIANKELAFQNNEKEKRADELTIANIELAFQNDEKGKRADELTVANKELAFQNEEKEKRAAEKEKRAVELGIANKELAFQNKEKEKRAAELSIANIELAFQNDEKEKRAAELVIANKELAFQNDEKEKRAAELIIANKELLAFTYVSSHDLQEPLRKIQTFVSSILKDEHKNLSDDGKYNFQRMQLAAARMQQLIEDLLAFSRISTTDHKFEKVDLNIIIEDVKNELKDTIQEKNATIESNELCPSNIIPFQFRQLMYNLISNALKFARPDVPSHVIIKSRIEKGSKLNNEKLSLEKNYCHITVKDNGIGFEPHFSERIFGVFQKLHSKEEFLGTGIGLAIVKKIVENHNGIIIATSELNKGATFDIYIPAT